MTRTARDVFRARLRLVAALLLLLPLASCLPESTHPVPPPSELKADRQIASCLSEFTHPIPPPSELKADRQMLGTWVKVNRDYKSQLCVFSRRNGWIDIVGINGIDNEVSTDGITVDVFEGYSAYVNGQKFLCSGYRQKDRHGKEDVSGESHYSIMNYETPDDDTLILKAFSSEKVKELIKEGKLKGEVIKYGRYSERVIVTSPSAELVETISKEGVGAFLGDGYTAVFSRSVP